MNFPGEVTTNLDMARWSFEQLRKAHRLYMRRRTELDALKKTANALKQVAPHSEKHLLQRAGVLEQIADEEKTQVRAANKMLRALDSMFRYFDRAHYVGPNESLSNLYGDDYRCSQCGRPKAGA